MDVPRCLRVEVVNAARAPVKAAFVKEVLARAALVPEVAARLGDGEVDVAVRITSDREMRRLNMAFAGEDHSTDVLSFEGERGGGHLGDIAVSWPAVARQAVQFGHAAGSELALLCVHGLLHLLGWDHVATAETREMARLTRTALRSSRTPLARHRL